MLPVAPGQAKPVVLSQSSQSSEVLPLPRAQRPAPPISDVFEPGASGGVTAPHPHPDVEPVDGREWMQDALEDIKVRVANGESVKVVFDLDDTIWDNRPRTLELARRFDAERGTHLFDGLTLDQVGKDGYQTARNAGLGREDARAFDAYWRPRVFTDEMTQFDAPMPEIDALAQQAHDAGAQVIYMTGRPDAQRDSTRAELQRLGLPLTGDAQLIMKPSVNQPTAEYKVAEFRKMLEAGDSHLAWFITESRRDLGAVQDAGLDVPTVLLDAPWERGGRPVDPGTPVYPSQVERPSGESVVLWAA